MSKIKKVLVLWMIVNVVLILPALLDVENFSSISNVLYVLTTSELLILRVTFSVIVLAGLLLYQYVIKPSIQREELIDAALLYLKNKE